MGRWVMSSFGIYRDTSKGNSNSRGCNHLMEEATIGKYGYRNNLPAKDPFVSYLAAIFLHLLPL